MVPSRVSLLAQADLLLLMANTFHEPSNSVGEDFSSAAGKFFTLCTRAGGDDTLLLRFNETHDALANLDLGDWRKEFTCLFEGGVECPINEAGFIRRDKGAILGDVAGFYRAFGFHLAEDCTERVDHLACELEFTAMLLVLLAQAEEAGRSEPTVITRDALHAFAFSHLGAWAPAFCERLNETTTLPFYGHLAILLDGVWALVCRRNALQIPSETDLPYCQDEGGTPYECGLAEAGLD